MDGGEGYGSGEKTMISPYADATDKLSTLDKVKKCTAWSSAGNVWLLQAALPSLRGSNKNVPATLFNRLLLLGTARRRP